VSETKRGAVAYIALGSNLGDRRLQLERAVEAIGELSGVTLLECSRVFETEPFGPPPQADYLNAVVQIECDLAPRELLDRLLEIERRLGRDRSEQALRWGPRTLDLDLLLYGDFCIREDGLEVPHPRLHERPFVLAPLCDVAADEVHPRLAVRIGELFERAGSAGVREFSGELRGCDELVHRRR